MYMKISYAITVCNESKELYSLIAFLIKVKDTDDEINILVDSLHSTSAVKSVLNHFKEYIVINEREFCGNFSAHRNFHINKCFGDYIFVIDADEMPKEKLIKNIKSIINDSNADIIMIPRINIHPGMTDEWILKHKFNTNELGWINWPDYQGRIFKNDPTTIHYNNELHEMVSGAKKPIVLQPDQSLAIWHIKSIDKQDNRWDDGKYVSPNDKNLYDSLM